MQQVVVSIKAGPAEKQANDGWRLGRRSTRQESGCRCEEDKEERGKGKDDRLGVGRVEAHGQRE